MDITRIPPQNMEAEQAILGCMLIEKEAIAKADSMLRAEDFYKEAHRKIFQVIAKLYEKGEPIDLISVTEELRSKNQLEEVGGSIYITELANCVPTAAHVEYYAKLVQSKSILRNLIGTATQIAALGYEGEDEIDVLLDQAEQMIFSISQRTNTQGFAPIKSVLIDAFERLEQIYNTAGGITGVATGFNDLDYMTSGFQPSDLIIIAARPSMGKTAFCLNIAQNVAVKNKTPVVIFSLEMSKEQLAQRMLCAEARINGQRLRNGQLQDSEWQVLSHALSRLSEAPIFIDDTPSISVMELRAKSRRIKAEHGLGMVIIDYLQLMQGRNKIENRQQEISEISRSLKALARELQVPVIALSQLSRAVESRINKRPQLSDLRESGCLTGDTLVVLAESSQVIPICQLVGKDNFTVWALNPSTLKLEPAKVSKAFSTGVKKVYRITTALGRTIRATGNHKFLTIESWKRLDELAVGQHLALPRFIPTSQQQTMANAEVALLAHLIGDGCTLARHAMQYTTRERDLAEVVADLASQVFGEQVRPRIKAERSWFQVYLASTRHHTHGSRSAVSRWLEELGVWNLRSYEKYVPGKVFQQPTEVISLFLRHLWSTDGCIHLRKGSKPYPKIYYATSSRRLAQDVQSLLLRLGINSRLAKCSQKNKGRDQYHVLVSGKSDLLSFAEKIGAVGCYKNNGLEQVCQFLVGCQENTNRDVIPKEVWEKYIRPSMEKNEVTNRQLYASIGTAYGGMTIFKQNMGRSRALRIAEATNCEELNYLSNSDVYWDQVISIEEEGYEEVFDLTVPGPHNFVANDIIVHNSIEQDADLVMFIYRDEYYNPESEKKNLAEIIISKQRNGPVGTVELVFLKDLTRFENKNKMQQEPPPR